MNARNLLLAAMTLSVAVGCQNMPEADSPDIDYVLVTFPADDAGTTGFAGSKRSYHGQDWPASLHVRRSVTGVARGHGLIETQAWPIKSLELFCVVYAVADSENLNALVSRLSADKRVVTAHPMQEYRGMIAAQYDDPLFELQYGEHRQALSALHAITRGEDVRIGVIDSHVDTRHPDLTGQIRKVYSLVDGDTLADQRHGTAVVGIIGAAADNGEGLVGLAPAAAIHAYAACGHAQEDTRCTSFYLAQALDQAIEDQIDILNLSLAGPTDPLLRRLIEHAASRGMLIVAADNSDVPSRNFPASMPQVQAAIATAKPWFARGEQFSTQAGGGYQVFYGSSVAAAGVTGAAALLRSQHTAEQTRALLNTMLNDTCETIPSRSLLLDSLHIIEECP